MSKFLESETPLFTELAGRGHLVCITNMDVALTVTGGHVTHKAHANIQDSYPLWLQQVVNTCLGQRV